MILAMLTDDVLHEALEVRERAKDAYYRAHGGVYTELALEHAGWEAFRAHLGAALAVSGPSEAPEQPKASAGDILLATVSTWIEHSATCAAEDCHHCDVLFNHMRLAWKVWTVSRHKATSPADARRAR